MKKTLPLILIILIIGISLLAPYLAPHQPNQVDMQNRLAYPSSDHWLGTDSLGRDIFSRVLYGGRQSIILAFFAVILSLLIGLIVGFLAGYHGKTVDFLINIIINIFSGLPSISIKIAIIGIFGTSVISLLAAVVVSSWISFARVVRGEVMRIKNEYYISAAVNFGFDKKTIFLKEILPNLSDSLTVLFFAKIGSTVLSVAALSYLGLGFQPPSPDWAVMISDARPYFRSYPLMGLAPGFAILLFVWSVLAIGDNLRDKFDIRGADNLGN